MGARDATSSKSTLILFSLPQGRGKPDHCWHAGQHAPLSRNCTLVDLIELL